MKTEQTECSETSAHKIQTPGNHQKEGIQFFFLIFSDVSRPAVSTLRVLYCGYEILFSSSSVDGS